MLFVSFVYDQDATMLSMLRDQLKALDPEAIIYAVSDPDHPVDPAKVDGVHHRTGAVNRGGNLNGLPIIAEELAIFKELMKLHEVEHIIKIDADCFPLSLGEFEKDPHLGLVICERWQPFTPAGMCYRISFDMAGELLTAYKTRTEEGLWQDGHHWPEDVTIWGMACQTGIPVRLLPFVKGYAAGMREDYTGDLPSKIKNAHFVHCGEPAQDGTRVSRAHATARMRALMLELKKQ
jgi:hypothetical protein